MKALSASMAATLIGTAVGLSAWIVGIGHLIWPTHPQWAGFLLTLAITIVVQIAWPRLATNLR
jgi:hypothetical protein